jgi:DNA-binding transcriptional regulator YhcF (GntR family)
MARNQDKKGRSKGRLASFIALERYITAAPAWQSLSLAARCGYLELLDIYNGSNNGTIALSARMLSDRLRVSRATAARALNDLTARGFIEATRAGGFNLKSGERRATEWRLNRYKCDLTGQVPSQQYMRWKDGKIHFTVSPESHTGLTREPLTATAQQCFNNVALT